MITGEVDKNGSRVQLSGKWIKTGQMCNTKYNDCWLHPTRSATSMCLTVTDQWTVKTRQWSWRDLRICVFFYQRQM